MAIRRRRWHPTPVLLPGKSHGWRSLVGCSPWGREGDTTERLHFHFSLSCIGEGNINPLHYSCLENPRDGGAWWAAIYGVAQSQTQLKRLSSSSKHAWRVNEGPRPNGNLENTCLSHRGQPVFYFSHLLMFGNPAWQCQIIWFFKKNLKTQTFYVQSDF